MVLPAVRRATADAWRVAFFDRSWYNRAGVERVMGFATDEEIDRFFDQVVPFEEFLVNDGIHLVKVWLSVAQEEQVKRLDSRREENLIYYILPEGHGLSVGDEVIMLIDWPRRNRLMQLHFAAELILELVTQKLGLEKVGAHIAEHKARIDFKHTENISTIFDDILSKFNEIIKSDKIIQTVIQILSINDVSGRLMALHKFRAAELMLNLPEKLDM